MNVLAVAQGRSLCSTSKYSYPWQAFIWSAAHGWYPRNKDTGGFPHWSVTWCQCEHHQTKYWPSQHCVYCHCYSCTEVGLRAPSPPNDPSEKQTAIEVTEDTEAVDVCNYIICTCQHGCILFYLYRLILIAQRSPSLIGGQSIMPPWRTSCVPNRSTWTRSKTSLQ